MTTIAEARAALVQATNALVTRRQATADAQEKRDIDGAIADINAQIGFLNQMGLLQAAVAVSDAANELQAIVDTARLGPFDNTSAARRCHPEPVQPARADSHAWKPCRRPRSPAARRLPRQ